MKIDQVIARIEARKPSPPPNLTRVLDGEVVDGKVTVDVSDLDIIEDSKYNSDLDFARGLLSQCAGLMEYLHDAKLNSVIEPVDRKELRTLAHECRVFLTATDTEGDSQNIGNCRFYIKSSCIKQKLGDKVLCGPCKKFKLRKDMIDRGLVTNASELSERDMKILENIELALNYRGVDV